MVECLLNKRWYRRNVYEQIRYKYFPDELYTLDKIAIAC